MNMTRTPIADVAGMTDLLPSEARTQAIRHQTILNRMDTLSAAFDNGTAPRAHVVTELRGIADETGFWPTWATAMRRAALEVEQGGRITTAINLLNEISDQWYAGLRSLLSAAPRKPNADTVYLKSGA